jgi:hypothetical protein
MKKIFTQQYIHLVHIVIWKYIQFLRKTKEKIELKSFKCVFEFEDKIFLP